MNRGYAAVGLYSPRKDANIGGALRAAYCYDAKLVAIRGKFYKYSSDTPKTHRHIPILQVDNIFDAIPHSCVPVAVELVEGARNLIEYHHPERAFYIFGPENSSLGKEVLSRCRDIIQIPTKTCMNLASTVNVVLYDRLAKQRRYDG